MPTFYDSIEIARDGAMAKFQRRATRWPVLVAFFLTLGEAVLALLFVRLIYRILKKGMLFATGRGKVATVR